MSIAITTACDDNIFSFQFVFPQFTPLSVLTGVYGLTEVLNVKYEYDWF